jgi:hypothetical protein
MAATEPDSDGLTEVKAQRLDTDDPDADRALSLSVDSAGGYAVPKQLDGTKPKRKPSK